MLKINPVAMKNKLRLMKIKFKTLVKRLTTEPKTDCKENLPNVAKNPSQISTASSTKGLPELTIPDECSICLAPFEDT